MTVPSFTNQNQVGTAFKMSTLSTMVKEKTLKKTVSVT